MKIFCGALIILTAITAVITSCTDEENPPANFPNDTSVTASAPEETPEPEITTPSLTEPEAEVTEPVVTEEPVTEVPPTSADLTAVLNAATGSLTSDAESGDSSLWIMNCFKEGGILLPRSIKEQAEFGAEIDFAAAEPGDLIFFTNDETGEPHFGGIYTGDGMMIYSTGEEVKSADITTKYWNEHFVTARRI